MGYHKTTIQRGSYGNFSKIEEEFLELKDANEDDDPILELCEISDLIGAIEGYVRIKYNITLGEVMKFMEKTKSVKSGLCSSETILNDLNRD